MTYGNTIDLWRKQSGLSITTPALIYGKNKPMNQITLKSNNGMVKWAERRPYGATEADNDNEKEHTITVGWLYQDWQSVVVGHPTVYSPSWKMWPDIQRWNKNLLTFKYWSAKMIKFNRPRVATDLSFLRYCRKGIIYRLQPSSIFKCQSAG